MRLSTACRCVLLLAVPTGVATAQRTPPPPDSAGRDSAVRLVPVHVTVARGVDDALRLPRAVGVQTSAEIRRGRATLGADEALNNVPGVFASNRYNYALDQLRLSVRGSGARANFGARGIRVLLDGVSQTLPDGQSQLTNIELGNIGRIEVLRGAASSLYGNGSGGVISFETDLRSPDRLQQEVRLLSGSFGLTKWQFRTVGRSDRAVGSLSVSHTALDGFRQYSEAEVRQLSAALNYAVGPASTLEVRAHAGAVPRSLNPGALTEAEWRANPDSAVPTNVLRGASKEVRQEQASLGWRRNAGNGTEWRVVGFAMTRSVDNPLAAQPPAPRAIVNGTRVTLDRRAFGVRFDFVREFGSGDSASRLAAGLDAQHMRDVRKNQRTTLGRVTALNDTLLVHQLESVLAVGPFVQLTWTPVPRATMAAGVRWDHHVFKATDRHLTDGFDDSGERTMAASSGHLGASYVLRPWFVPYANIASAFETPTTTEMQVRPTGLGGFNPDLDPQTTRSIEFGGRGEGVRGGYELAFFLARTQQALIQYAAENDRTYFRNAGSLRSFGGELGVRFTPVPWFETRTAYTYARYRFDEYRIPTAGGETVLDGKNLAGVPEHFVRTGLRLRGGGASFDADWTWSDAVWGDDANTARIEDWGAGRVDLRLAWSLTVGGQRVTPFVGVNNALDEVYVGSVTLNAFGGRYRESAPRRNWYAGIEFGWSVIR